MAEPKLEIILNGASQTVRARQLSVLQIRALFAVDPALDLVIEGRGGSPDRVLVDRDVVEAEGGPVRLYARPQTMFGAGAP